MPDLSGKLFDVVIEPLVAGDSIEIRFEVQNTELGNAGEFQVGFYLSDNEVIWNTDKFLGSYTVTSLAGGTTTGELITNLTLPGIEDEIWQGDGTYYFGMMVDSPNSVDETDENNNANRGEFLDLYPVDITVTPPPVDSVDLSGKLFDIETLVAGDSIGIRFEVQNTEVGNAGEFQVEFYLSDNEIIWNTDRLLGAYTVTSLAGGTTTGELTTNLTLPGIEDEIWQGDGTYYFGMMVDSPNSVDETDENNNANTGEFLDLDAVEISLTPPPVDLSGKLFDVVKEPLGAGDSFDVRFEVQNTELGNAGEFQVEFYLSNNEVIWNTDKFLGSYTVTSLAGGTTTGELITNLTLPGIEDEIWQGEGTYYLGMMVDSPNSVNETNENNNFNTGEFLDLDPVEITLPKELSGSFFDVVIEPVLTGQSFEVQFQVENTQIGNAGEFQVDFYISNNDWISENDQKLGSYTIESLAGQNNTGVLSTNFTLPIPDPENSFLSADGTAYIGMIIDSGNTVSEINENNNANTGEFFDFEPVEVIIDEDPYEENDDRLTAYNLSDREGTWLSDINGLGIVKAQDEDWYKIEVSPGEENLVVDLQFSHAEGDIDLILFNELGNIVTFSNQATDSERINIDLSPGIYYVGVQLFSSPENTYDLWWDDSPSIN